MKTPEEILDLYLENYPWIYSGKENTIKAMKLYAELYYDSEVKKLNIPAVIKSVCIAPKGECDRKPEDVCKECEGCKYLEKTVL